MHTDVVSLFPTLNDLRPSSTSPLANHLNQRFLFHLSNIQSIMRINNLLLQFRIRHQTITMK